MVPLLYPLPAEAFSPSASAVNSPVRVKLPFYRIISAHKVFLAKQEWHIERLSRGRWAKSPLAAEEAPITLGWWSCWWRCLVLTLRAAAHTLWLVCVREQNHSWGVLRELEEVALCENMRGIPVTVRAWRRVHSLLLSTDQRGQKEGYNSFFFSFKSVLIEV